MLTEPKKRRWRRLWLILAGCALLVLLGLGALYAWTRYTSYRDLELALAETDKLDPHWRLADLEAQSRPMPPSSENGFEQAKIAASMKPAGKWPEPSFPQFDKDPIYQQ